MKTIEELRMHHNVIAEQALMCLIKRGKIWRSSLDDFLSDVMKQLIGESDYKRQELDCIGVIDETVKSLLKDGLVEEEKAMIAITRKGRFVDSMIYAVYARMKGFALLGVAIDALSKLFKSITWFLCFLFMAASLVIGLLLAV